MCLLLSSSGLVAPVVEAASTSEASVNLYHTTWHDIPEDCHRNTHYAEKFISHLDNEHFDSIKSTELLELLSDYQLSGTMEFI
jgi:hypothetical protein